MEYRIETSNQGYFEITITGRVIKSDLHPVLSEIFMHPDYENKHTLWDYSGATLDLNLGDIEELSGILKLINPESENFADKSAIVVPGELDKAKVSFFISLTRTGPLRFKVFTDKTSAENYLMAS